MNPILLLAKLLGVRRVASLGKRLVQFAMLAVLVVIVGIATYRYPAVIIGLGLCVAMVWAVARYRPRRQEETGPRTIDGKIVPDMLAAAALDVPAQSPDGDYVLRGLPDYGKVLLKLSGPEFEYLPEVVPDKLPELPEPEPAENPSWLIAVPRWVWVPGVAALLIVAGVSMMTQGRERHPVRDVGLDDYLAAHAAARPESPGDSASVAAPQVTKEESQAGANPPASPSHAEIEAALKDYKDKHAGGEIETLPALPPDSLGWNGDAKGLKWPMGIIGSYTYNQAAQFCETAIFAGNISNWRLPTEEELRERLYGDGQTLRPGFHAQPGVFIWTSDNGSKPKEPQEKVGGIYEEENINWDTRLAGGQGWAFCVHD